MPESAKKSLVILVYLALALSTIAVFWQVRNFGFIHYDDPYYVYENQYVSGGLNINSIIWAFTTGHACNWHPITWLSLMLDCQLFGLNPGWMHMENVLLHIANTLLLFAVFKKMTGSLWPSVFVAALFALHPMHVESVVWITERKDVLSALFWILTIAAYYRYTKRPCIAGYLLALLVFALGLMAKPMLVTLPFVLLLLDYWPLNRFANKNPEHKTGRRSVSFQLLISAGRLTVEKIPFFILSAVSSVITFLVQDRSGAVSDINALHYKYRIANTSLSYVRYIGKMFWPSNLAVFYPFDAHRFPLWQIALCILFIIVISVAVLRLKKNYRYLPTGWFWFIGTLIPVIGLVQAGSQSYADRYTYIPYIGLFIMIAWSLPQLLAKLPHRKIVFAISMLTVLTALGISAHKQTMYWNNSSTLFSHALEVTNNNYVIHNCLGQEMYKQGKLKEAIVHIKSSLQIEPGNPGTKNNLAWLFATCSDPNYRNPSEAIRLAQQACHATGFTDPGKLDTLATAFASAGRFDEAVATAQKALNLANENNNKQLFQVIKSHLDLYKASKPLIEKPQMSITSAF
jgi:hypothetical protein